MGWIVLTVLILIVLVTAALSWFIVRQQTTAIIERLGKYDRVANAGLTQYFDTLKEIGAQ